MFATPRAVRITTDECLSGYIAAYNKLLPISSEKKKDLLDLLPLIPPVYHSFYKDLRCTDQEDIDPDLIDNTV
ncbi:Uncharacterized protein FWK35_00024765 [Aphis craccivora]|uniref:Uncharacterized protein n=1 Tax=Aphis craccivora TaxID=307492 RepID=A0A6G0X4M6_APHCR|nr:Uncharacterized protein FWK35_00024765 [Aphis craccivora]